MPGIKDILTLPVADQIGLRKDLLRTSPELLLPWWRPCATSVLIVTDGGLDFGTGDFGLSTFVSMLINDGRSYVKFSITLAHLRSDVPDVAVMSGATGVARSIKDFHFDNPDHFTAEKYDEVWLFGIEISFWSASYSTRNGNHAAYPQDRLSDAELVTLNAHMRRGGGVFATGDHGALGRALCGSVNRVRSMRYWNSQVVNGQDEVGMSNARRNDTTQPGDAGTQFSDQSDDIPQPIHPKLYSSRISYFRRERYPHPVLCGPGGRITVLPDHPHEGQCIEPAVLTDKFAPDGSDEYPPLAGGGARVAPEVIAHSHVLAGNTATLGFSSKAPTQAHTFGAISAYNGHAAGVGRVVCDATWHHFVNVNLIGVVEGGGFDDLTPANSVTKHDGFMSTAAGQAVLQKIKEYYVNIGVWIAPPARHACFRSRFWWHALFADRIVEASLVRPDIALDKVPLDLLEHVGTSARDVIGRMAGQCASIEWIFDWFRVDFPELVREIEPWPPVPWPDPPPYLPVDPLKVFDVAIGAAVISLRQQYPYPSKETLDVGERAREIIRKGIEHGLARAISQANKDVAVFERNLKAGAERAKLRL
jgi:hypothetical protein